MDSLRKEIQDEMNRTRLDKNRLYSLLLKIVDGGAEGSEPKEGPVGPQGPVGPVGPQGPAGPAGECKCKCVKEVKEAAPAPKKVVTKKKVTTSV
jgi:hypothetical protein